MSGPTAVTRRRALALGAAAGLGSLVRAPDAGWAASAPAATRSFSLRVPEAAWSRGGGRATGTLRAPRRFDLLGLRGRGLAGAGAEVRVRRAGMAWGPWAPFGSGVEHAPDRPRVAGASDPVWAGGADELQLRARRAPRGLRVHFVALAPLVTRVSLQTQAFVEPAGGALGVIPRAQWGAETLPPRNPPEYGDVQMAFVHHTVTANTYAPEQSAGMVLAIAKYHRDTNGWNDIGYNLLVDQYGQIFEGRSGGLDLAVIGAQAQGWNAHSTGIAALGTFTDVPFPEAGMAALARVLAWKLSLHLVPATGTVEIVSAGGAANRYRSGVPVAFERISGHRDGCTTTCPGEALYGALAELRTRAAALAAPQVVVVEPRLTLVPAAVEVVYGLEATFSGTLLGTDAGPVVGAPVSVQKQGSFGFVTVGRAITAVDGTWGVAVPWRRGAAVQAVSMVSGNRVVSSPVSVGVAPILEVAPTTDRLRAGRTAVVTGRVRPSVGVRVVVERQTRTGRWARVGEVEAGVRGTRFSAKAKLRYPGLHRLTAQTGGVAAAVKAPEQQVRVVR